MAACPSHAHAKHEGGRDMCMLPGEQIGPVQSKSIVLVIHGGRLAMVAAELSPSSGVRSYDYLASAITAKYGDGVRPYREPFVQKWFIRRQVMELDYLAGTLTAYDRDIVHDMPASPDNL